MSEGLDIGLGPERTAQIAARMDAFVRDVVVLHEKGPRRDHHDCPSDGPTEVRKWNLARKIKRDWKERLA